MTIRIIADGPSDLPITYFEENNLFHIPHGVILDGKYYQDKVTIQTKVLMDAMRAGAVPTTSQGPLNMIQDAFKQIAADKDQGIYLVFSSSLSGTYASAQMLKEQMLEEYPDFQMEVVDTKCASTGLGLIVKACTEKAQLGASFEEVIALAKYMSTHMEHLFTVDNLDYIARGGRMKRSSAFVGGLLNIKPLLTLENGGIVPLDKFRGKKKLYDALIEKISERADRISEQKVGICHADCLEDALEVKDLIADKLGVKQFEITEIGGSIGAHAGPGTIAIAFLNKLYDK